MNEENEEGNWYISVYDMKQSPIFKEIHSEKGHPDNVFEVILEQLQDMGFEVEKNHYSLKDEFVDNSRTYNANIEATRYKEEYGENHQTYKNIFLISLFVSIFFFLVTFWIIYSSRGIYVGGITTIISTTISIAVAIIFKRLSNPEIFGDYIWIKIKGNVYSGLKAKEIRDGGKHKSGVTRSSSSNYVHSELLFYVSGDSDDNLERLKEDIKEIYTIIEKK